MYAQRPPFEVFRRSPIYWGYSLPTSSLFAGSDPASSYGFHDQCPIAYSRQTLRALDRRDSCSPKRGLPRWRDQSGNRCSCHATTGRIYSAKIDGQLISEYLEAFPGFEEMEIV
jgi:hypothetical protein